MVLQVWYTTPEFTDQRGHPAPLTRRRFRNLCDRAARWIVPSSPRLPASRMLRYLRMSQAVSLGPQGLLSAQCRSFRPVPGSTIDVYRMSNRVASLLQTANYNIAEQDPRFRNFEQSAYSVTFDSRFLPRFRRYLQQHASGFIYETDEWLAERTVQPGSPGSVAGICLFMFTDALHPNTSDNDEEID